VEWLSGKPVELWPALQRERGSWAGWWVWLSHTRMVPVPVGQGSSCSMQSWSQAGPDGWVGSGCPGHGWGSAGPEGQWACGEGPVSQQAVGPAPGSGRVQTGGGDPDGCGSGGTAKGGYSGMVWLALLRGRYLAMCGSGTELWPGAARGVESPAERNSGSANL
jgi:hypothetical protein